MQSKDTSSQAQANKHQLAAWIASGWGSFFIVLFFVWWLIPEDFTAGIVSSFSVWVFAISHLFFASLLLFVGFLAVGATRWQIETADALANPATSKSSGNVNAHNRVHTQFLSNTAEQFIMFGAALLAATPFLTPSYLRIIPLMTILWVFGRLFFWAGYWYTATHNLPTYPRAIGLGIGLLCTLILASIAAIGISLHYPNFSGIFGGTSIAANGNDFSLRTIILHPEGNVSGSNIFPIIVFTWITAMTALLAIFPRLAPPVVPLALLSVIGWAWVLFSGSVPIRF